MECKSCGAKKVLVEGLTEGKSKVTCQECGFSVITNNKGQQLLTGQRHHDKRELLMEG